MTDVLKRSLRGGLGFLTADVISRAANFLFVVVAGRLLGPAGFGILSLGLSVAGIARRIAEFGLPTSIVRFLAGEGEREAPALLGAAWIAGGGLAVAGAGGLWAAAPWLGGTVFAESGLADVLRVLSLALLAWVPLSLHRAALQGRETVRKVVALDAGEALGKLVLVAAVLLAARSAPAAAAGVVAGLVVPAAVGFRQMRSLDVRPALGEARAKVATVLGIGGPLLVVGFGYTLARYADRIFLGALSDASAVGVYTVASALAAATLVLHGALVAIFKPVVADAYRQGKMEEAGRAYRLVSRWAGVASGAVLVAFAGLGPLILSLFGSGFATPPAHRALLLLTGLFFVATWIGPTGAVLQMSRGERIELVNTLVFLVLNVGLNVWLIPRLGIVGAALATLASGLARNLLQIVELVRLYDFRPLEAGQLALPAGVLAAGAAAFLARGNPVLAALVLAASLGGLVTYLVLTMTETEREYAKSLRARLAGGRGHG